MNEQQGQGLIRSLDHLVLTVADIEATVDFYQRLGMTRETFGPEQRTALVFGTQKINLHAVDRTFEPKATHPTPGSADLCFLVGNLDEVQDALAAAGITIIEGPGPRTGAQGPIRSIYVRDPDQNLIELSEQM
jgi:catechol 2,3-dioxygenase-like lactoylglutathione lyase family enzyme